MTSEELLKYFAYTIIWMIAVVVSAVMEWWILCVVLGVFLLPAILIFDLFKSTDGSANYALIALILLVAAFIDVLKIL